MQIRCFSHLPDDSVTTVPSHNVGGGALYTVRKLMIQANRSSSSTTSSPQKPAVRPSNALLPNSLAAKPLFANAMVCSRSRLLSPNTKLAVPSPLCRIQLSTASALAGDACATALSIRPRSSSATWFTICRSASCGSDRHALWARNAGSKSAPNRSRTLCAPSLTAVSEVNAMLGNSPLVIDAKSSTSCPGRISSATLRLFRCSAKFTSDLA